MTGVDKEHRWKATAANVPPHLENSPAIFEGLEKNKPVRFLWNNLQLPLYVSALMRSHGQLAIPAYFTIGSTEADVSMQEWTDFSTDDLSAAEACADWVVSQISAGVFWPPSEKVPYDDFGVLAAGKSLVDMVMPPG